MNPMSDEKLSSIIQTRLSMKDNQLRKFATKFLDFTSTFDKLSLEQSENISKEIITELEVLEFQIFKAEMSHYICLQDKNYFQNLSDSMQKEIETIKNSIDKDTLKLEIEEEKKRNKIEYNLIAENVIKFDEKKNLQEKIDIINNEIQILTKNHQDNILSISQKEKELHLLLSVLTDFQVNEQTA